MIAFLAAALAASGRASMLGAQGTRPAWDSAGAILAGFVRDSAGVPIAIAGVELDGDGRWTTVSPAGGFRRAGLTAGRHVLRVRALGYAPIEGVLTLPALDSVTVDVTMAPAARALDTVRAVAPAVEYGPAEFQERRRRGNGFYLTRDEFEQRAPTRLSDLLAGVPGVERKTVPDRVGSTSIVYVMRGVSTVRGEVCPVSIYVDGRGFDVGPEDLDRLIRPNEVEAIEVYAGSSQVPLRYAGPTARCGVIALWTRNRAR